MAGYIKKFKSDGPPPLTMAVQTLEVMCAQKLIEENNLFNMIYDHDYLEDERLSINECHEIAANFADNEDETFYDLRRKVKDFLRDKKKCDVTATIIDSVLRLKNCPVLKVGAYHISAISEVVTPEYMVRLIWEEVNMMQFENELLCEYYYDSGRAIGPASKFAGTRVCKYIFQNKTDKEMMGLMNLL